jgi:hypothetical protein
MAEWFNVSVKINQCQEAGVRLPFDALFFWLIYIYYIKWDSQWTPSGLPVGSHGSLMGVPVDSHPSTTANMVSPSPVPVDSHGTPSAVTVESLGLNWNWTGSGHGLHGYL